MAVPRKIASAMQKAFFAKLQDLDLVLGAKQSSDHWAVNLHGRFFLVEKDWGSKGKPDPRETLLALQDNDWRPSAEPKIYGPNEGEPPTHVHVDWDLICWARFQKFPLDLIVTDRAIRFYRQDQQEPPEFAFYYRSKEVGNRLAVVEWQRLFE